jgi:hypothetical protein
MNATLGKKSIGTQCTLNGCQTEKIGPVTIPSIGARWVLTMKRTTLVLIMLSSVGLACSSGASPAPSPPCDQACQDGNALLALRETMKLAYNLMVQGMPVGPQDATAPCPMGGSVHITGTVATSNAVQGTTQLTLTYVIDHCAYQTADSEPKQVFNMTFTGTIQESGTISAQGGTTALTLTSDSVTLSGTVYDPPIPYEADGCALQLGQNGNRLAGMFCGRSAGVTL